MEWLFQIITACLGCTTLVSFILYRNSEKRVKNAEANKAEIAADEDKFEMYEKRLQHCNEIIELHNTTIQHQGASLQKFDDLVREKTLRIRQISDELYNSESELNRVNSELVRLTSELGKLKLQYERYRLWHCRIANCPNRIPPRPELKDHVFETYDMVEEIVDGGADSADGADNENSEE